MELNEKSEINERRWALKWGLRVGSLKRLKRGGLKLNGEKIKRNTTKKSFSKFNCVIEQINTKYQNRKIIRTEKNYQSKQQKEQKDEQKSVKQKSVILSEDFMFGIKKYNFPYKEKELEVKYYGDQKSGLIGFHLNSNAYSILTLSVSRMTVTKLICNESLKNILEVIKNVKELPYKKELKKCLKLVID